MPAEMTRFAPVGRRFDPIGIACDRSPGVRPETRPKIWAFGRPSGCWDAVWLGSRGQACSALIKEVPHVSNRDQIS